jgi:hypothetical protein
MYSSTLIGNEIDKQQMMKEHKSLTKYNITINSLLSFNYFYLIDLLVFIICYEENRSLLIKYELNLILILKENQSDNKVQIWEPY